MGWVCCVAKAELREWNHQLRPEVDQQMMRVDRNSVNLVNFPLWTFERIAFRDSATDIVRNKQSSGTV
jgi:hypothetical protein